MPITAVIIVALFAVQRQGTAAVGRLFGPVMIVWFVAIGACGVIGIVAIPRSSRRSRRRMPWVHVRALPHRVLRPRRGRAGGHRRRGAVRRHGPLRPAADRLAWVFLVLPACVLSYLGQGALILGDESTVSAPFFLLTPDWARLPMVLLATAATIIASQAVITGAFSVASQAAQLGYLPRLRVCTPRRRRSARSTCRRSTAS